MTLQDLTTWLETQNLDLIVPHGFGRPMSYRGYYDQLAFEPVEDARLGDMLQYARNALGATYTGYKGGDYTMDEFTDCWIAEYGTSQGDLIGPTLLKLWEATATMPTKAAQAKHYLDNRVEDDDQPSPILGAVLHDMAGDLDLAHVFDVANMRYNFPDITPHWVQCMTFEDGSKLARFLTNGDPEWSQWTEVKP